MRLPLMFSVLALTVAAHAQVATVIDIEHIASDAAAPGFHFRKIPPPCTNGLIPGRFSMIDGRADANGGDLDVLTDGFGAAAEDQPDQNFFFFAGTDGGRLLLDLKETNAIQQIDTYSWHTGSRAPQVYKLYAASGTETGFTAKPKHDMDPLTNGWKLVGKVDTRPKDGNEGGQYGVSIRDASGPIGHYRYLLFDCSATETNDGFGNTFYSEIDVRSNLVNPGDVASVTNVVTKPFVATTADGKYEITIDTSAAPDLTEWATNKLAPALIEWYPKIVAYFPSDDYEAPAKFRVLFKPGRGVADTAGTRVNAYIPWMRKEMKGEAIGSLVHEAVHVVQQYGRARRNNPDAKSNPGWLVEGIADYYRWYKYEPQTHGAEISKRGLARARYDAAYRPTANFLDWVSEKYDTNLVPKFNAAMRAGNYSTNLWTQYTGKTAPDLGAEWLDAVKKKVEAANPPTTNAPPSSN